MQTETLNIITREFLLNKGYPLHYYLPTLHRAINAVENLSKDVNMGGNIKTVEITLVNDRATYPAGCINILKVYGLFEGKEKAFLFNGNISPIVDAGGYEEGDTTIPKYKKFHSIAKEATSHSTMTQFLYDNYPDNKYEYNIDRVTKDIVLAYGHELTKIYVTYMAAAIGVSAANTVPVMAKEAIKSFIEFETARNDGSPQSKVSLLKEDYSRQKSNLISAFNPMTIEDFLNYFR
jgi:hypothetical protein